jgi:YfiH family protein
VIETVTLPSGDPEPLPLLASTHIRAPFSHGFSMRAGGVSGPPFEALNLGGRWGDDPENVQENRRLLLRASGARVMHFASQVHGRRVVRVRAEDDPAATAAAEADVLCSDAPGIAVAVFTADCVPLLISDPTTGAFAAVHAGWRGVVAGVAQAAVRALETEFGSRPADLRAAMGPAIGPCCFQVGPEVVAAFTEKFVAAEVRGIIVPTPFGKAQIDLKRAVEIALEQSGLSAGAIDAGDECTKCDQWERFYSYRRDGARTGQHLAFITRIT